MHEMILLNPEEVWGYFHASDTDFESYNELIAYNEAFGVEIFLGSYRGFPQFSVLIDNALEYEEFASNAEDCEDSIKQIYKEYLENLDEVVVIDEDEEEETEASIIQDNEDELDSAIIDFVVTATKLTLGEVNRFPKKVLDDLKEHFLEYMYRIHGIEPYRPMVIEYDIDEEEFSCSPYPKLEFDSKFVLYPKEPPIFDISKLK